MEISVKCPCCGTEQVIRIEPDAIRYELERAGWRKRRKMNLSDEERERRRRQGESLRSHGRPKGQPNSGERIDKGVKRGSMKRGSEL